MLTLPAGTVTSLHWPVGTLCGELNPGALTLKSNDPWTNLSAADLHSSSVPCCGGGGVVVSVTVSVVRPEPTTTAARSMFETTLAREPLLTLKLGVTPFTGTPGETASLTRIVVPGANEYFGRQPPGEGVAVSEYDA